MMQIQFRNIKHKLGIATTVIKFPICDDAGTIKMVIVTIKATIIPRK
jgi:hypothetical protein